MTRTILGQWHERGDRSTPARNNRRPPALCVFQKSRQFIASHFRAFVHYF
jgi:hypothetical protein